MKALQKEDPQIYNLIKSEEKRLRDVLEMIPSENYISQAVMDASGSVLNIKYSEGYPKKRYYQGNVVADEVETIAIERAKKLFGVPFANVQAHSGSPANVAVYLTALEPGDTIMGLKLAFGGHLTHGADKTISSRFFRSVQYELGKDGTFDFDAIEKLAKKEKPKIIVSGATAYPRIIDFKKFGEIAKQVGAFHLADVSHIAGLIIAGVHPSPVPYADFVTTTTHKTLRGPRGAIIMVTEQGLKKDPDLGKKVNASIIPGMQGGPHDNQTAAIAVALLEAGKPSFKKYGAQIVKNCKALAKELTKYGFELVSGGTDNHLILINLRNKKVNGRVFAIALERAGIVTNYNMVPYDPMPPLYASGLRTGTAAITSRGMKEKDMVKIAKWFDLVLKEVEGLELPAGAEQKDKRIALFKEYQNKVEKNKNLLKIAKDVKEFANKFPITW